MDGWNTSFLSGWPIFRGELLVAGRVSGSSLWCPLQQIFSESLNLLSGETYAALIKQKKGNHTHLTLEPDFRVPKRMVIGSHWWVQRNPDIPGIPNMNWWKHQQYQTNMIVKYRGPYRYLEKQKHLPAQLIWWFIFLVPLSPLEKVVPTFCVWWFTPSSSLTKFLSPDVGENHAYVTTSNFPQNFRNHFIEGFFTSHTYFTPWN